MKIVRFFIVTPHGKNLKYFFLLILKKKKLDFKIKFWAKTNYNIFLLFL